MHFNIAEVDSRSHLKHRLVRVSLRLRKSKFRMFLSSERNNLTHERQ